MPGAGNTPPGESPGKPKILFGTSGEERATASTPPAERQPRVLFPAGAAEEPQAAPAPDKGGEPQPAVLFGSPQPPTPKGTGPKVLAGGTIRQRIPCTAGDLQRLDASATPAIIKEALRIIQRTNLDDAYFDDALRFGAELQAEHGAITEEELALARDESVQQGQTTLTRMIQLCEDLDPQRLFMRQASIGEAFKTLLDPPRPPWEVFEEKYPRLLSLARDLRAVEPQLLALSQRLRALEHRYVTLIEGTAGYVLAANFIARYVREQTRADGRQAHYTSQADALESRAASLLVTRTTVEIGRITNQSLRGSVQALLDAGRGMLEEDLPAFHTAYTAALAASTRSDAATPDASWLKSVHEVHERVTRRLKGRPP